MKVKWEGKEYELKYSFRAMTMFENVTGTTYNVKTYTDTIVFFYCTFVSSSRLEDVDFDEFIDYLDDNPQLIEEFSLWFVNCLKEQNKLMPKVKENKSKTAKKENPKN